MMYLPKDVGSTRLVDVTVWVSTKGLDDLVGGSISTL